MRIDHLYRYPVKGMSAEALEEVALAPGEMLPDDRRFALAHAAAPFSADAPAWLDKRNFACLMVNARIALLQTSYDARARRLTVRGPGGEMFEAGVDDASDRAAIAHWVGTFLGDEAPAGLRFVSAEGHRFSDTPAKVVSLINRASIAALEQAMGMTLAPLRFRANVYFSGAPAWAEFDWLGRQVELGGATVEIVGRIDRCAATTVNPETAVRVAQIPRALRQHFGHIDMGVFARVVAGGRVALGDPLVLREAESDAAG